MRRIDRLMEEARLLRIARAIRAQELEPVSNPEQVQVMGRDQFEVSSDFMGEMATARLILEALAGEGPSETGDARRKKPIEVLDLGILMPFVHEVIAAIEGVVERMAPVALIDADMMPKVIDHVTQDGKPRPDPDDLAHRARRSAVRDVAQLAVEQALVEAIKMVVGRADLKRSTNPRKDRDAIVISGGRVRRDKPKATAARAAAVAHMATGSLFGGRAVKPRSPVVDKEHGGLAGEAAGEAAGEVAGHVVTEAGGVISSEAGLGPEASL